MAQATTLTKLPPDILYSIFPYLSACDFLNLINSTKELSIYRQDPTFWRNLTRKTFRIPPQPLLEDSRWQWLYKKLRTQTQVYTWGNNGDWNLGRPCRSDGWPGRLQIDQELGVGIIADVQCGGWSTTILDSVGQIFVCGRITGNGRRQRGLTLRRLGFPPAYPPSTKDRYEPSTAINQHSHGRSAVLGLADDGKVWMWQHDTAFQVKPMHVDLVKNRVDRVVSGWDKNSMFVTGVGIVYWTSIQDSTVLQGGVQETLAVADMMLIDSVTVPGTGLHRNSNARTLNDSLESRIGIVIKHVVLSEYIVFTTDLQKVFCYPIVFPSSALDIPEPIELTTYYTVSQSQPFRVRDLQGSFERFAIFTYSGSIFVSDQEQLRALHSPSASSSVENSSSSVFSPSLPPSLQSGAVVSLAFGDHHYHALHANGTVTSYGKELQQCGALGLGNSNESVLRGVHHQQGIFGTSDSGYASGRTVWFERTLQEWSKDLTRRRNGEAAERSVHLYRQVPAYVKAYADYFENEGAKWEKGVAAEGEMGAYYVFKVAAAGWHSAALVLVDEEKAQRARESHLVKAPSLPPPPQPQPRPSPAISTHSSDSNEAVDSPSEQLAKSIHSLYEWLWNLGRWFLGLTAWDTVTATANPQSAEDTVAAGNANVGRQGGGERYDREDKPFPRLRLENGEAMPGEVPITD